MSKRGPIILIGVVAVVLLCAPYAIGMINENAMRRQLEVPAAQPGITRNLESIDRGWFSSEARIDVGIDPQYLAQLTGEDPMMFETMLADFSLPVIVEISHGPVLLADGLGFGTAFVRAYADPESQLAVLAEQILGMPHLFAFHGRGGFGSGFRYEGSVPPIDFAMPDISLTSTGITFSGVIDGRRKTLDGELANLTLQSPFAGAVLESLTVTSDMTRPGPDTIPLGTGSLAIGRLAVTDPMQGATPTLLAEGAGIAATVTANDDEAYLDMDLVYELAALDTRGFELGDLALGVRLGHIDAEAANGLQNLAQAVPDTTDAEALRAYMLPLGDRILAGQPTLTLEPVHFTTPDGELDGRLSVAIDSAALPGGTIDDLQNPDVLRQALSADLELTASRPLAEWLAGLVMLQQLAPPPGQAGPDMTPEQRRQMAGVQGSLVLGALAAQGLLLDDGDAYSTMISLSDGALTANGQPLPMGF